MFDPNEEEFLKVVMKCGGNGNQIANHYNVDYYIISRYFKKNTYAQSYRDLARLENRERLVKLAQDCLEKFKNKTIKRKKGA